MNKQTILIVDDEPTAIKLLFKALEGVAEFRFETSGAKALTTLRENSIDMVLLDAMMPGMDGYKTCEAIKADYPDLPVIFVTSATDVPSEMRALEVGAIDFINKPFSPPVVRARVQAHLKLKEHADLLRNLSKRDPLTGIANRRWLDEQTDIEWRRAHRNGHSLALLMIDIDHFKAYNDHYGHIGGDACLRKVAWAISNTASRAGDLVVRYGGEEFAVLMPETSSEQALVVARRVCESLEAMAIPHASSPVKNWVTVSVGAAAMIPQDETSFAAQEEAKTVKSYYQLFNRADEALYAAKQAGRNQAILHQA